MELLGYQTLKNMNYQGYLCPRDTPVKVLQFGEGNFMRAFVDYWFDEMNEKGGFGGRIILTTPIAPSPNFDVPELMNAQDCLYTLYLQGRQNGDKVRRKKIISSVQECMSPQKDWNRFLSFAKIPTIRFLTSNTTEAGIVYDPGCKFDDAPVSSFPGKLCRFLYERWKAGLRGFIVLACELIDHNGDELKRIVLQYCGEWKLEAGFREWVENENIFCSTLVDRIVPGYPAGEAAALTGENGYADKVMDTGEIFGFWVIEGPQSLYDELPIKQAGLQDSIIIVDDHTPYKQRKVRILNGAHTSFVPGAYLAGQNIVRDCMADDVIKGFMNRCVYDEIIPTLTLPKEEVAGFASTVADRFQNPFIEHRLLSICLNSTSKWKARVLPSLKAYFKKYGRLPVALTASLAMYAAFYRGAYLTDAALIGLRGDEEYEIKDDRFILEFYDRHKRDSAAEYARAVCSNAEFWGEDLSLIPGLLQAVADDLNLIEKKGAYELMRACQ